MPSVDNENSGQVNNVQSNGRQSDNQNNKDIQDVSATASNQVTPVSEDISQDIQSEILVPLSSVSPDVGNVSTAKNINDNMVASEISEQEDGTQTTARQQGPNPIPTPTPAPGLTPDLTQDPILTPTLVPTPNPVPTPEQCLQ